MSKKKPNTKQKTLKQEDSLIDENLAAEAEAEAEKAKLEQEAIAQAEAEALEKKLADEAEKQDQVEPKALFNTTNHTFFIGTSSAKPKGELVLDEMTKSDERNMMRVARALETGVLVEK